MNWNSDQNSQSLLTDGISANTHHVTPEPSTQLLSYQLCLRTNHFPKDPSVGFVFGTDPDECDILLTPCEKGSIGARQFAVTFRTDTGAILFKNLSKRYTRIEVRGSQQNLTHQVALDKKGIQVHLEGWKAHLAKGRNICDREAQYTAFLTKLAKAAPDLGGMPLSVSTSAKRLSVPVRELPYEVDGKIGQGGGGTVYKAYHKITGDLVAIKRFSGKGRGFWNEAYILHTLEHVSRVDGFILTIR